MNYQIKKFGDIAVGLARNPLRIIALFIVLVYGFASLITVFSGSFTPQERLPLIYFLVLFPVLVLVVFAWLVSFRSGNLFGPEDFKHEENYVKMQLSAVASLATAAAKTRTDPAESDIVGIVEAVRHVGHRTASSPDGWSNRVLWVDDRPSNNVHERRAFEALGLEVTLADSTDAALEQLSKRSFGAIISDMGRREGPREGYVLLDEIRRRRHSTPLFFYAGSSAPEHRRETAKHGGQGCTNNAQELFQMVTRAVIRPGALAG